MKKDNKSHIKYKWMVFTVRILIEDIVYMLRFYDKNVCRLFRVLRFTGKQLKWTKNKNKKIRAGENIFTSFTIIFV